MPAPVHVPVFRNRTDTFFGVCEAIGQDFGFNANYLRVVFGALVLVNPLAVAAGYAVLGVAVAASRLMVPTLPGVDEAAEMSPLPEAVNDAENEVLAAAA